MRDALASLCANDAEESASPATSAATAATLLARSISRENIGAPDCLYRVSRFVPTELTLCTSVRQRAGQDARIGSSQRFRSRSEACRPPRRDTHSVSRQYIQE